MNNGPSLVIRGAIFGCFVVSLLVALIHGSSQPAALAAEQPTAKAVKPNKQNVEQENKESKKKKSEASSSKSPECNLSSSYPDSIQQWCELINEAANQYELPADLIAALIWQESGGQELAYSSSGAVGLMQVMPRDGIAASFECVNGPCFASRPTTAELQDPAFNIDYGTRYLAGLVEKRGSIREALFGYGPMNVGYSYADKVLGIYETYGGD